MEILAFKELRIIYNFIKTFSDTFWYNEQDNQLYERSQIGIVQAVSCFEVRSPTKGHRDAQGSAQYSAGV